VEADDARNVSGWWFEVGCIASDDGKLHRARRWIGAPELGDEDDEPDFEEEVEDAGP
jgi:hypothetical protein